MRETLLRSGYTGLLLAVTGALAWATGRPLVFPSLGPSAYLLATAPETPTARPRRVVGGHVVGVAAGLVAYWTLAPGLVVTTESVAFASGQARLAASAVLSVALTTAGMLLTDTGHAPACATTLIVSLGLLATPPAAAGIVASVLVLTAVDVLVGTRICRTRA